MHHTSKFLCLITDYYQVLNTFKPWKTIISPTFWWDEYLKGIIVNSVSPPHIPLNYAYSFWPLLFVKYQMIKLLRGVCMLICWRDLKYPTPVSATCTFYARMSLNQNSIIINPVFCINLLINLYLLQLCFHIFILITLM